MCTLRSARESDKPSRRSPSKFAYLSKSELLFSALSAHRWQLDLIDLKHIAHNGQHDDGFLFFITILNRYEAGPEETGQSVIINR